MKNRLLLWTLALLSLASCTNADVEKINLKGDHLLTADIENAGSTRTAVENGGSKVLWNVGEEISVFLGTTGYKFKSLNTSPAASADFEGTPSLGNVGTDNPILALSPYKSGSKVSDGLIHYNLPASQQAVADTYDPNAHALVAYSPTVNIQFYNVTGGIRFTLKQSGITDITLKGNNNEILAGDLQIKASGLTPSIQKVTSDAKEIKLLPPAGGFKTGVWYYITTIPVTFSNGFTIDFKAGVKVASFTTDKYLTVSRGGYGSIAEIDKNLTFVDPTVHVESIAVSPTSMTMAPGETKTITATVLPANATDKSIKWSSNTPAVATVDDNGKVTAKAAGSTIIVALTNDGYKTATCNVTVAPPVSEMRSQFAEGTGITSFGNVIHYKYGTKYGTNANQFYVMPWGNGAVVEDSDAAHFSATSSKTDNVSVSVVKAGNGCMFAVNILRNPTTITTSWSDLTFTYKSPGGSSLSKTTRVVVFHGSAANAFSYQFWTLYNNNGSASRPDLNSSSTFTHVLSKTNDENWLRIFITGKGTTEYFSVADTREMADYTFSTSNSSVVKLTEKTGISEGDKVPFPELNFKDVGTSNVVVKYVDYKGNVLSKTFTMTVKKNFLAGGDYIKNVQNALAPANNSSSNREYIGSNSVWTKVALCKSNGTPYTESELADITWTCIPSTLATLSEVTTAGVKITCKGKGDFTIQAKGKDGSTRSYFMTGYMPITSITPNSTTYSIGLGTAHTMNFVKNDDFTITPSDATFTDNTDFQWSSTNSAAVSVSTTGVITGKAVGTATIKATAKPWYNKEYTIRTVKTVDYRLKVTSGSAVAPNGTLYANNDVITLVQGDAINVCYATPSGSSHTFDGTCRFAASSVNTGVATAIGSATQQFATIKAIAAGTTYVDLDYTGNNGRIMQRYLVRVLPKFTWAANDIASNTFNERPKSSPFYLKVGGTVDIYAYKGKGSTATQYTSSQAAALTWTSKNTSIATVSTGVGHTTKVTGKSAGLAEIVATDSNGNTRSWWVQVYVAVTAINGTSKPFYIGSNTSLNFTHQMKYGTNYDYTCTPSNATYAAPDYMIWSSSNASMATVGSSTGLVTVKGIGVEGSFTIKARPSRNGANVSDSNVRTFKYVLWEARSLYQSNGGVTVGNAFRAVPPSSNNVTVKKGSMTHMRFATQNASSSGSIAFTSAKYSITSSNSNVTVNAYNPDDSSHYVWFSGSKTGTADITISAKDDNHYFEMKFKVTVTE